MGKFYHSTGSGVPFGPSEAGESLADYKARVKRAYGNLQGVKFGKQEDFHLIYFSRRG